MLKLNYFLRNQSETFFYQAQAPEDKIKDTKIPEVVESVSSKWKHYSLHEQKVWLQQSWQSIQIVFASAYLYI